MASLSGSSDLFFHDLAVFSRRIPIVVRTILIDFHMQPRLGFTAPRSRKQRARAKECQNRVGNPYRYWGQHLHTWPTSYLVIAALASLYRVSTLLRPKILSSENQIAWVGFYIFRTVLRTSPSPPLSTLAAEPREPPPTGREKERKPNGYP